MISKLYNQVSCSGILANKARENIDSAKINLIALAVIIMGLLAAVPVYKDLWTLWNSDKNFEGFMLVPVMCGLMFYKNRQDFVLLVSQPTKKVLYCLPVAFGVMTLVLYCNFTRIAGLLLVINVFMLLIGIWGHSNYKLFAGPILFLILMVPPPLFMIDFLTIHLQKLFSLMVEVTLLCCSSAFVERYGFEFWFDNLNYPLIIAPECSGVRSLQGFIVVASFFSIFERNSLLSSSLIVSFSVIVALVLNFLRIIITMWMRLSGLEEYSIGFWHGLLGIAVFAFGCMMLGRLSNFLYSANLENSKEEK